jgi:hypothetical protein
VLGGAFLSTTHTGTGTDSGGGSAKEYAVGLQIVGGVLGVATFTAVAVHHLDQTLAATEIARIQDKAATEIARVEGDRKLSEQFWKAEVERHKHDLQLAHTQDYEPYQASVSKKKGKKRGGIGGLEEEEKKG